MSLSEVMGLPTPFKYPVCGEELERLAIVLLGVSPWLRTFQTAQRRENLT